MAIFDSRILTGKSWMSESIALFSIKPSKWLLLALIYIVTFMMIPSLPRFQFLSFFAILAWPTFMVAVISMYRNADTKINQNISETINNIKPKILPLLGLGIGILLYSELISYVLNADIKSLTDTAKSVDAMSDSKAIAFIGEFLPFLLKLTLALLPVMMATWFSPMLIVFNNYRVLKAVKSSIAGSLQYMIALSITWIILTLSIFAILLFSGVVIALIGSFAPLFGQLLMPLVLFGSLLVATALMFAFQYVSYRDVFRSA